MLQVQHAKVSRQVRWQWPSFVGTKWTWRDGALWHLTTYASGWQEWKTFDEVAQSWHWVTQADKEALKDCAFARQLFLEQFF